MLEYADILTSLNNLTNKEDIYHKIIAFGKKLPPFDEAWKVEEKEVKGCQSLMYLHAEMNKGSLFFYAHSEALISAGLAALLISFYNGKSPEWILKNPPHFLTELNIVTSLTPSRANGLSSLYTEIKKWAVVYLIPT